MAATGTGDLPKVPSEIEADITKFDASKLKQVETVEKHVLPSTEEISQEKTIQSIGEFDKNNLKRTSTTEKNILPTKEVIQEEKRASLSS
jgi:hypothetical protein